MPLRDVYENLTSSTIERLFVALSHSGRVTSGILLWREAGVDTWNVRYNERYYTDDLKEAKAGTSKWFRYLGKMDFEGLIITYMSKELIKLKTAVNGGHICNTEQA